MEVMDAIKGRRAIRRYLPDPVSPEALSILLEAARWAPSWGNSQCWRLLVVRDRGVKGRLAEAMGSTAGRRENRSAQAVREAPVVIVGCAQLGLSGMFRGGQRKGQAATDKGPYWYMFDLALAMQNLTLAAHSLGLGTVHVGMFDSAQVAQVLNVPDDVSVVEIMPLGYPAENPETRPRQPVAEFVFYDGYGEPRSQL
ncbi:MAG: nitroreductase family protein [Chloroflexi bacterium]|nr:nitroreductase family protein [Chloroflexota bacterium]